MAIVNNWVFTKTSIEWEKFISATKNQYKVVSVRNYRDKKGNLPDGVSLTLQVIKDDYDYGVDKNGNQRETNLFQNFDVTVLNDSVQVVKGDYVALEGFIPEYSFVIGFDMILRFKSLKVLKKAEKTV